MRSLTLATVIALLEVVSGVVLIVWLKQPVTGAIFLVVGPPLWLIWNELDAIRKGRP